MVAKVKPIVAIVGETASGKTDLGIAIAKKFNGEIVSADSWVVRREVNIGTAKPDKEQLRQVRHHMIDIISPCEDYSAARYKEEATNAISDIHRRGKLPVIVGGTGLYIDSLLFDYSFLPPAPSTMREELNSMHLDELILLASSKKLPINAIDQRNKRRVIRLIETNGQMPSKGVLRPRTLMMGLVLSNEELKDRISLRAEAMLEAGLRDEVEELYKKYGWDCEALKGIGYSEWKLYFEGKQSIEKTTERIIKDTILLAKRQRTWFKRNKSIHWLKTPVNQMAVEDLITTFLNKNAY